MKYFNKLLCLILIITCYKTNAQVFYTTSFDGCNSSACSGWTISSGISPSITSTTGSGFSPCNTASAKSNIYGSSIVTNLTSTTSVGVSDGNLVTLNFSYKCIDYGSGAASIAGSASIKVSYSTTSATGPWTDVNTFNNASSSTCLSAPVTTFTPTAGNLYIRLQGNRLLGDFWMVFDDISISQGTPPACPAPTSLGVNSITNNSANITWSGTGIFILEYGLSGFTPGTGGSAGTGTLINPATSPQALTGLSPVTAYDVYIRQDCTSGSNGYSTNVKVSFTTLQIPATLPYTDNFTTNNFAFTNGSQTNKWAYGSATGNPANSIYVSNDGGTTNAYTLTSTSVVHAYRDIAIPAASSTAEFKFDWKGVGESSWDYLRVWLVPTSFAPIAGTQITAGSGRIQVGGNFDSQSTWQTYSNTTLDVSSFAGQTMRLVYEWRNDGSGGTQPPAAVDNISLLIPACATPTALNVSNLTSTTATIGWTTSGSADSYNWEIRTTGACGSSTPVQSGNTISNSVNLTDLTANTTYTYCVRSVCAGPTNSDWASSTFFTGYCTPASTSSSTYINNFSTTGGTANISNLSSGYTTGGYQDNYSSQNVTLSAGNAFTATFSIVGGTAGVAIWVDLNNNLNFETSEKLYNSGAYLSDGTYNQLITIPGGTPDGMYRMRILTDWNASSPSPCSFSGTRGESEDYKVTIVPLPTDAMDFANLQSPPSSSILTGSSLTVFTQGYELGVTEAPGAGTGITVWIGVNATDTDPSTWASGAWTSASFNAQVGDNDEFQAAIGSTLPTGTYYYASRWQLNGGPFKYGGYNAGGGGFWNGTSNVSGVLTVTASPGADCSNPIIVSTYPYNASSTTCGSGNDYGVQCGGLYGGGEDLVYQLNITSPGDYQISVNATGGGSYISWFLKDGTNCANTSSCLAFATSGSGTLAQASYTFGSAGTYYLIIDTWPTPNCSAFDIVIDLAPPPPANDDCTGAVALSVTNGLPTSIVVGNIAGATASSGVPVGGCNTISDNNDIWYKFVVPASGNAKIELFATGGTSNFDNDYSFQVFSGACGSLSYINCNEDGSIYPAPSVYLPALSMMGQTPGNTIWVRITKDPNASQTTFSIGVSDPTVLLPVASGECAPASVTITPASGNAYRFVPLLDASGGLVGELFANGQNLGSVTSGVHHNTGAVRSDASGKKYLDRDFTVNVQTQPTSATDLYLYLTGAELSALMVADPSVTGVASLNATKMSTTCGKNPATGGTLLTQFANFTRTDGVAAVGISPSSFSTFYLHGGTTPLPVTLVSFEAKAASARSVVLNWTVVDELNITQYIVESSSDGKHWSPIGSVKAAQTPAYSFRDDNPSQGINYYRLQMAEANGSAAHSPIRQVIFSADKQVMLAPNPTSGQIYITGLEKVTQSAQISIYNELGLEVWSGKLSGTELATAGIDLVRLVPGTYVIRVITYGSSNLLRFVKQ